MLQPFTLRSRIIPLFVLLVVSPAMMLACSCVQCDSPCRVLGSAVDGNSGASAAFVGVALASTKDLKLGDSVPVRVEEVFWGLAADVDIVSVDVSSGSSCGFPLVKGERYVLHANRSGDAPGIVRTSVCSQSFRIRGREKLLDAIRKARNDMSPSLVGTVLKYVSGGFLREVAVGVRVIATNNDLLRETVSDTYGEFYFPNLLPGEWSVHIDDPLYTQDLRRSDYRARVSISEGCDEVPLHVWPNGSISGIVGGVDGTILANVPVQAFIRDRLGRWDWDPVRIARTDHAGRYKLNALPQGEILVAVNGTRSLDVEVWPATYYPGVHNMEEALPVTLAEGQQRGGVDLVLPAARTPVEISVAAYFEDGQQAEDFRVSLLNTAGVQRAYARQNRESLPNTNLPRVKGFLGNTYVVSVACSQPLSTGGFVYYKGEAELVITETHPIFIRVVLREKEPQ